jgi:outer membrane protein insertion porin family
MELRYPITLKSSASIYALGFLEAFFSILFSKFYCGSWITCIYASIWLLGIDFGHGFDAFTSAK